jgi:hypothetical protein
VAARASVHPAHPVPLPAATASVPSAATCIWTTMAAPRAPRSTSSRTGCQDQEAAAAPSVTTAPLAGMHGPEHHHGLRVGGCAPSRPLPPDQHAASAIRPAHSAVAPGGSLFMPTLRSTARISPRASTARYCNAAPVADAHARPAASFGPHGRQDQRRAALLLEPTHLPQHVPGHVAHGQGPRRRRAAHLTLDYLPLIQILSLTDLHCLSVCLSACHVLSSVSRCPVDQVTGLSSRRLDSRLRDKEGSRVAGPLKKTECEWCGCGGGRRNVRSLLHRADRVGACRGVEKGERDVGRAALVSVRKTG